MDSQPRRIRSELPGGDPALLNKVAWARRWADRDVSVQYALSARKTASAGTGKRSRAEQGLALKTVAWQARWRGELSSAMSNCLSAETFLPESEYTEVRAGIYSTLGMVHFCRNRLDLAKCAVDRGIWLLRDVPDAADEAMTDLLLTRAAIQRHSGERARAAITLGRAREICTGEMVNCVDFATATWLLTDGDPEQAQEKASEGLEASRVLGNRVMLPYLHSVLGACDARMGRADAAVENFKQGLSIAKADADKRSQCFLLREYAMMENECGNADRAMILLRKASELAKSEGFAFERKRAALCLAEVLEQQGQYKLAVDQHKLAWRLQNETRVR